MRRHTTQSRLIAALACLASTALFAGACAEDNSVVGGACATGYTDCDNQCVLLSTDPDNCGGCGVVCHAGPCVNGACTPTGDAGADGGDARVRTDATRDAARSDAPRDGKLGDGEVVDAASDERLGDGTVTDARVDGEALDGTVGDGQARDGSGTDGAPGDGARRDASACIPPFDTPDDCGACGVSCPADQVCSPTDAGAAYACIDLCVPPLVDCSGVCVDEQNDPDNCGACGTSCPSGICVLGVCSGTTAGNLVVIGHDYAASNVRVSEATLLSNAVFLHGANPLHVISFEQYVVTAQVTHAKAVLTSAAHASGRTLDLAVVTDATQVPGDLASGLYDVLLVYDQASAPAGSLAMIGASWQSSLATFLAGGGDVVVLDGASGPNSQMPPFLTSAGLLATSADVPIASSTSLFVVASADAVGESVVTPYAAQADTVSFVTSEANGGNVVYVVLEGSGASAVPVVIHKTFP